MSDLSERICRCGHTVSQHSNAADGGCWHCDCTLSKADVIATFLEKAESLLADMEEKRRLRKALRKIADGVGTVREAAAIADEALN